MEKITKDMVVNGYKQGLIRLAIVEYAVGVVCVIGDNWFYFGGDLAEISTVEEYKKYVSEESLTFYFFIKYKGKVHYLTQEELIKLRRAAIFFTERGCDFGEAVNSLIKNDYLSEAV